MKTALAYHLVARLQSCRGDFRTALLNERETYQIYKQALGEQHERTRESAQVLKHLTEQAVMLQKKMIELSSAQQSSSGRGGNANANAAMIAAAAAAAQANLSGSIHIQQPSMQTVLAMLNIINGIIFIPSAHEHELERFRDELIKYQQQQDERNQESKVDSASSANAEPAKSGSINQQDDDLQ